ncbi:MAG: hypothetical protein LBL07_03365 [Tannerella sp.]|jgi:hypothetical protein|nr:hypothetical protein [Tannerella sp.]
MSDSKLEQKIREHFGEIFGSDLELPSGHRERFERQLKSAGQRGRDAQKAGRLKKWLIASVAAAAAVTGFLLLTDPSAESRSGPELADVRNYYSMQLEEQVDATRQLIRHVDEAHREELLADIEQIENEPVPDVQIPDDEYIVLIAGVYTKKIETLRNLQDIIRENI